VFCAYQRHCTLPDLSYHTTQSSQWWWCDCKIIYNVWSNIFFSYLAPYVRTFVNAMSLYKKCGN
jgi:hypothetical protein